MNKIQISSLTRLSGLALLAACFVAGHANAQVFRGRFTLPFQARWGQATLPAGDYSFTLDSVGPTCTLHLYRGKNGVGMILAQSYDKSYSGHAVLTVEQGTVRTLRLPELGIVLQYMPQRPKHLTAPEEWQLAQFVPVVAAARYLRWILPGKIEGQGRLGCGPSFFRLPSLRGGRPPG
jgi:hypothetical protein